MEIRLTKPEELPQLLRIYARARTFMAQTGNPNQWGPTHWPPEDLLREDIARGRSRVCLQDGKIVGTFCYIYGVHIDPTYDHIQDGAWSYDLPYGAVHRIASDGTKGVGTFCLNWALTQSSYLRIDTHPDNRVMLGLLAKLGFRKCGIIHVIEDHDPRYAFDLRRRTENHA